MPQIYKAGFASYWHRHRPHQKALLVVNSPSPGCYDKSSLLSTGRVSLCRLHVSFQGLNEINAQRLMPPYFTLTSANTSISAPCHQDVYYYAPTKGWDRNRVEAAPYPARTGNLLHLRDSWDIYIYLFSVRK